MGGVAFFKSTTAGASWTDVCPESLHVDHHAIAFGSDGRVWVGNDGGVWSTADGGATWDNRNANLQIAQFYPGASIDPSNYNRAIGGTPGMTFRYRIAASEPETVPASIGLLSPDQLRVRVEGRCQANLA